MITRHGQSLIGKTGAVFSDCMTYRYKLWRVWDDTKPSVMFLMLNPSTADESENDPTVERCERRARQMGFGALAVCNLFAFRATDPKDMKAATDPVGTENDAVIIEEAKRADLIVCAWGTHGSHSGRSRQVRAMLNDAGIDVHCLRIGKTGEPGHPLYIAYSAQPFPMPTVHV